MNRFLMGWAEKNITPGKKVSLAGQFSERISEYVEKPLTVTALAVSRGAEAAVFCSCDLVDVGWSLLEAVRALLAEHGEGPDPEKIIVNATHTHTGPGYANRGDSSAKVTGRQSSFRDLIESELPDGIKYIENARVTGNPEVASDDEMLAFLSRQIADCILEAWSRREPASFSNAFGRAAVGMCRRAVYSNGNAIMWGDTDTAAFRELEGGNDSGIELLYCFDNRKKLAGVVANVACPAQCVQHRLFISPDYWGEVKKLLRKHWGSDLFLLPLCSAAGDQCPVDLVRWVAPETPIEDPNIVRAASPVRKADPSMFDLSGMRKVGRRVAEEIIQVYESGLDSRQENPVFRHSAIHMSLPLRRTKPSEVRSAKQNILDYLKRVTGNVNFNNVAEIQGDLGVMRRAELQERMNMVDIEVHVLRLGNIAFASFPFELFLDYGNRIRAMSRAEQTFLIELANGDEGYLPTEKAEQGGHYSGFIASGMVGHEGGDLLVKEILTEIEVLFCD